MSNILQSKVLRFLNSQNDTVAFNIVQASVRGVPDILVCRKGRFIGLEIKDNKDIASPIQSEMLTRITESGGVGRVVRSLEDMDNVISALDDTI